MRDKEAFQIALKDGEEIGLDEAELDAFKETSCGACGA